MSRAIGMWGCASKQNQGEQHPTSNIYRLNSIGATIARMSSFRSHHRQSTASLSRTHPTIYIIAGSSVYPRVSPAVSLSSLPSPPACPLACPLACPPTVVADDHVPWDVHYRGSVHVLKLRPERGVVGSSLESHEPKEKHSCVCIWLCLHMVVFAYGCVCICAHGVRGKGGVGEGHDGNRRNCMRITLFSEAGRTFGPGNARTCESCRMHREWIPGRGCGTGRVWGAQHCACHWRVF